MKRLLMICISIYAYIGGYCQETFLYSTNNYTNGIIDTRPTRNVEIVDDGVIVTYEFKGFTKQQDNLYPNSHIVKIDGFGLNASPGKPSLPIRWDSFIIPEGKKAKVDVIESQIASIPLILAPSRPLLLLDDTIGYSTSNVIPIIQYSGVFPSEIVNYTDTRVIRGVQIADVCISPINYHFSSNTSNCLKKLVYKITFENDAAYSPSLNPIYKDYSNPILKNFVLNANTLTEGESTSGSLNDCTEDYLIITTDKFLPAAKRFAKWKKYFGLNIHIISKPLWSCEEEVKDSIISCYQKQNGKLNYLLIVGDNEDVPSKSISYIFQSYGKNTFYSDCYYRDSIACSYSLYDLMVGRLPVSTLAEADIVVDKIINYEGVIYPSHPTFYQKSTHAVGFLTVAVKPYQENPFILEVSEDVKNVVEQRGFSVERLYFKEKEDQIPLFLHNGDTIPTWMLNELNKPIDPMRLVNAINKGSSYIYYAGHAKPDSLRSLNFNKSHVDLLYNRYSLPLLFSLGCYSGDFAQSESLAESLMRKENGGVLSVIAPTIAMYQQSAEYFMLGLFDAIWPDETLKQFYIKNNPLINYNVVTPDPTYRLGQIFNQAAIRSSETGPSKEIDIILKGFTLLGDPSMRMFTGVPTEFCNVKLYRLSNRIIFQTSTDGEKTISLYNYNTDETTTYKFTGNSITIPTTFARSVAIAVTMHNKIPYIDDPNEHIYVQNKILSSNYNFVGANVNIGSDVTTEYPTGEVIFNSGIYNIRANNIEIKGETTINIGAELNIITPKNQ